MKNETIPFWPKKNRELQISKLAYDIVKKENKKNKLRQNIFTNLEKEKIMRRLYHIANGTSNMYKLPLEIGNLCDKNSIDWWRGGDINLLKAYNKIKNELNKEGFKCKVLFEKYRPWEKDCKGFYKCYIKIIGIKDTK